MSIMDRGPVLGKHCFTYCGDARCNCERAPRYRCRVASAIEARSGETGTGSIGEADESAVAKPDAQGNPS